MRLLDEPDLVCQINIVPMIDVIKSDFDLVFSWIALFLAKEEGLAVNLPSSAATQTQQQLSIPITVTVW